MLVELRISSRSEALDEQGEVDEGGQVNERGRDETRIERETEAVTRCSFL